MPSSENWIELSPHPATHREIVHSLRARVHRSAAQLAISYRLEGDIARIVVPPLSAPAIGRELWRHTCFEAFLKIDGAVAYHEFNFAPSRQWTVYALSGYRTGSPLADETMNPRIIVRATASHLELQASVSLDRLSSFYRSAALRVGLAAVIETARGISNWALHHPAGKPDFHNPDSFALRLEPHT